MADRQHLPPDDGGRKPVTPPPKPSDARQSVTAACIPPWAALLLRLQFELNTLSSVSIEVPALRPAAKALREALGD